MSDILHWSFDDNPILREKVFAEGFSRESGSTLPVAEFDNDSDFDISYDLVYTGPQSFTKDEYVYYGSVRISKETVNNGVYLKVREINQTGQDYHCERVHIDSECLCRNEPLLPLAAGKQWRIDITTKNQIDRATLDFGSMTETAILSGEGIHKKDNKGQWYKYCETTPGLPLVSNWALAASAGTLEREREYRFDRLNKLESFSPSHKIKFLGDFQAQLGSRRIELSGYIETGSSIIPYFYWVDGYGRLLIMRFGLCALIYNESPRIEREV
jgi:hypothetical protein